MHLLQEIFKQIVYFLLSALKITKLRELLA